MFTLNWLAALTALLSFIFVIVSIFTIRGSWNSSRSDQEVAIIPLYVSVILIFITALLISYHAFDKQDLCEKQICGSKKESGLVLESTLN